MKKPDNEINYWPYAIVGMILTVVMLGVWTIKTAVQHPVQEANDYMMAYQDVDANINEILASQKAFDARYRIDLGGNRLAEGSNRVVVEVTDKEGRPVSDAEIVAIVQRPTTNKYNIELQSFRPQAGRFVSDSFELKGKGRWNIQVRVRVGDLTGFKTWKSFIE